MNNSLSDTEGYEDPEAYKIDEVPKSLNYSPVVPYAAQVITVGRILDLNGEKEDEKSEGEPNTTFQSERSTKYKYAFGSRVQTEKDFDKGLGVIGVGRGGTAQKRTTEHSQKQPSANTKPKLKKKVGVSKIGKRGIKKNPVPNPNREERLGFSEEEK